MIDGKKVLVVLPARGGSKGIGLKNLILVNGTPLVAIVGQLVKKLEYVDRAIVSTDHTQIAQVAKDAGLDVPFFRPEALSGDLVADVDVLTHALLCVEDIDQTIYDVIVMLQPTSPLRKPEHVTDAVMKLVKGGYDAVWTISKTDSKNHPLKQLQINDERLEYYDRRGAQIIARQQLSQLYHRNGAAYAVTRNCLINQKSIKGSNASAVVIDDLMISIDTEFDVTLVEFCLKCNEGLWNTESK